MNNADPDSQSLILQILLLIIFTLFNALLSASELAVASVNRNRIEQKAEEGNAKAKKLLGILKNPINYLSTTQIGITLVTIVSGASLTESLSGRLAVVFGNTPLAKSLSSIFILVLLTYIAIVFGELYPKKIALNRPEEVLNFTSILITVLGFFTQPFVWLLSVSTDLLTRITPITFTDENPKLSREEIRYMLETESSLDNDEIEMLQGIFSLDTKVAREVMVPRTDTFMVDIQDNVPKVLNAILTENYSRIPVYKEDKDKIVGILHTKNLLKAAYKDGFTNIDLRKLLQEPLFVPETVFIDDLLYELKRTQNQMAILLDEYGGVVGTVTLEDLLEEIVGEIDDESDEIANLYSKVNEHEYLIQGRMLIDEFNEVFKTDLHMNDVDTMAGYLITALGTIPDEKEKLSFNVSNLTLTSEQVEGTRLLVLRVIFHDHNVDEEPGENHR